MEISDEERIMEHCLNKSTNSTCPEMPYEESRILLVAVYSIVFALGIPANCLTSLLTFVQIRRNKVHAIYIFSLSLCDLMYLSTLPFWIIYVQNGHKWTMGDIACKTTGFIFFCNIYISILLLCCISLDRYIGLVYSLESKGRREQKRAIIIVCFLFAVVALIHIGVFFIEEKEQCTCFETVPLNILFASFNIARFILGFAIPFTILIFTNYNIFQTTKRSSSLTCSQKAKVKRLAIAIILIFLICFAPYHVMLIIRAIYFMFHQDNPCPFEKKIYSVFTVFLCLGTANGVADPIIYVLVSENIREETYRSLRRWRWNSSKLNSSTDHNTDTIRLETPKESEEVGQRKENKEIIDSSDHNTDTVRLEIPKESEEGGQRKENKEITDSSDHNTDTIRLEIPKESEEEGQRKEDKEITDSSDHNTDTVRLEIPKESEEEGQRKEDKEITDSSDI